MSNNVSHTRSIVVTSVMSALGFVLMLLEFPIPLIPSFIKFDFSELPAVITSFAIGPVYGVAVCLIKNLLHLTVTTSAGVGELSNFIIGSIFVFTAGIVYSRKKTLRGAVIGTLLGAVLMAVISIFTNFYIVYPFYVSFYGMPYEAIVAMYSAILPSANTLFKALVIFNLPFTLVKGIVDALICFACYKKLSPILKGNKS